MMKKTRSINAIKNGIEIELTINSLKAYVNGKEYTLAQSPVTDGNEVAYVNLRFISEALGYQVHWDKSTLTATITS
ncbi:copper amine oxidase N-terminal domain-containing protein [Paenibacillus alkaliterrae]|uniref:copper amine oxidase N-terminal domain-containing protein n=1 Tax=Paenibacillus alkaliterrae TaxID=320909 RepID=UPI001F41EFE4|nr:copper amine oxidase N-terminal domain-containing protein [Paenibacillus alkaliterrae]MCF2941753.1 copper amine oxidase N-terminal domain-containing protein [Paenibacillus alkaliterrae]